MITHPLRLKLQNKKNAVASMLNALNAADSDNRVGLLLDCPCENVGLVSFNGHDVTVLFDVDHDGVWNGPNVWGESFTLGVVCVKRRGGWKVVNLSDGQAEDLLDQYQNQLN